MDSSKADDKRAEAKTNDKQKPGSAPATAEPPPGVIKLLLRQGGRLADLDPARRRRADDSHDTTQLVDPNFAPAEEIDAVIKYVLLTVMILATIIWNIYFFYWFYLPPTIFAHKAMTEVFFPGTLWKVFGIHWLIVCPWVSSLYGLYMAVNPDPRKWPACCRQGGRLVRWVPYIILHLFMLAIIGFWIKLVVASPRKIRTRMKSEINTYSDEKTNKSSVHTWDFVQKYYQCCGIENKFSWFGKRIPQHELPPQFQGQAGCSDLTYGLTSDPKAATCPNFTDVGTDVWPSSCCDNMYACGKLPSSKEIWRGHCYNDEVILTLFVVWIIIVIVSAIVGLGIVAFYKTRTLESIALMQKPEPPQPHI